jgi:hypothetical protein
VGFEFLGGLDLDERTLTWKRNHRKKEKRWKREVVRMGHSGEKIPLLDNFCPEKEVQGTQLNHSGRLK